MREREVRIELDSLDEGPVRPVAQQFLADFEFYIILCKFPLIL